MNALCVFNIHGIALQSLHSFHSLIALPLPAFILPTIARARGGGGVALGFGDSVITVDVGRCISAADAYWARTM